MGGRWGGGEGGVEIGNARCGVVFAGKGVSGGVEWVFLKKKWVG